MSYSESSFLSLFPSLRLVSIYLPYIFLLYRFCISSSIFYLHTSFSAYNFLYYSTFHCFSFCFPQFLVFTWWPKYFFTTAIYWDYLPLASFIRIFFTQFFSQYLYILSLFVFSSMCLLPYVCLHLYKNSISLALFVSFH